MIFETYKCGAIPSPPDARDYSVRVQRPVALPRTFKQPIESNYNQGVNNCVPQVFRSGLRSIYGIEFGVDMCYGGFRNHNGEGMYPSVAATGLCKYGIAPLKYDPGEREVPAVIDYYRANQARLHKYAEPYKGVTWGRAYAVSDIKQALYDGKPIGGCFAISQMHTDSRGIFPCKSGVYGYHEMRIYGWDVVDGQEYACVQNSWGKRWGKNGECFVSWEDVLRMGDIIVFTPPKDHQPDKPEENVVIDRTLRKGMKGEDVKKLQEALINLGYDLGKCGADGDFGSATKRAVEAFQKAKGLKADGIAGKATLGVLYG